MNLNGLSAGSLEAERPFGVLRHTTFIAPKTCGWAAGLSEAAVCAGAIQILFHGDTRDLVRVETAEGDVLYPLTRRGSIKDIIEALGVPHTEIGRIFCNGRECGFSLIPEEGERFEIHPFTSELSIHAPTLLRPDPLPERIFLVDTTVVKLARDLRMAGVDTEISSAGGLKQIAEEAVRTRRILLSRNRDLLKIGTVVFAQLLRSENHWTQLAEVVARYGLTGMLKPFTRCLCCNTVLEHVAKKEILALLEPLTKKYYADFKKCASCNRIYWRGSHHQRMAEMLSQSTDQSRL